jgi:nucleoid-associated protein YgaU
MYQNKIKTLPKLNTENFENIFQVYTDENSFYYYNLLQTVNIPQNLPPGYFDDYTVKHNDTWPLVSYKAYKTPNLWWVIVTINNIIDPTTQPEQGAIIRVLKPSLVRNILTEISNQTF